MAKKDVFSFRNVKLFENLTDEELNIVAKELKEKEYAANVKIVEEKSVGDERNALKKIEIAMLTNDSLIPKEEKFFEIMIKQIRGSGLDAKKIDKIGMLKSLKLIEGLIEEGIEQGVLRKVDVETAATCLFGMMDHKALRWMVFGKSFSLEDTAKEAVDIFLRGIAKS